MLAQGLKKYVCQNNGRGRRGGDGVLLRVALLESGADAGALPTEKLSGLNLVRIRAE